MLLFKHTRHIYFKVSLMLTAILLILYWFCYIELQKLGVFLHHSVNVVFNPVPSVIGVSDPIPHPSRIIASNAYQLFYSPSTRNTEEISLSQSVVKKILFWTLDTDNSRDYGIGLGGVERFHQAGCPVWQCETYDALTASNISTDTFDAVVFFEPAWGDRKRPSKRSHHQRYVYWNLESPGWMRLYQAWNNLAGFFNWTMTYRWDSDIVQPYGWIVPVHPEVVPLQPDPEHLKKLIAETRVNVINHAKSKTKLVAWFVSNCEASSGRNEYVERLKKLIDVDVYGRCGTMNCSRSDQESCQRMLQRDYKFYLALENSLCVDYVTEKFLSQMHFNIVPIVFDLHGNHRQVAPPHSYINALDFSSVNALVDYLRVLDKDDDLYNEYFWWKKHYTVHDHHGDDFRRGFCHLCAQLHGNQETKIYSQLADWWGNQSHCMTLRFDDNSMNQSYLWRSEFMN